MSSGDTWNKRINIIALRRLEERITTLCKLKRYNEALQLSVKALDLARNTFGPDHPCLPTYLNNINSIKKLVPSRHQYATESGRNVRTDQDQVSQTDLTDQASQASQASQNSQNSQYVQADQVDRNDWLGKINWSSFIKVVSVLVAIISMSAGFVYKLPASGSRGSDPAFASSSLPTEVPFYRVKAGFDPKAGTVEGEEELILGSALEQNEIIFNLYFNRYNNDSLDASEMRRYAYKQGVKKGSIDILRVTVQDKPVPFKQAGEVLRVGPLKDLFPQGANSVKIEFKIKIPYIPDRSGGGTEGVWLGNWLPTLSADSIQHRPTEIGDPFINVSSDYEVELTLPKEYGLVLSDIYSTEDHGSNRVYKSRLKRVRDLPVFFNKDYKLLSAQEGETQINYYFRSANRPPGEVLDIAKKSMAFYRDYVGAYPWKQLNIVENDMYLNGMEYSTLLLLSSKAVKSGLEETVFHEVGHQWFYNIVGSDQYSAPFIDEGLVEFLTCYVLKRQTPLYHNGITGLNKSLAEFDSWRQYREVHYRNGRQFYENVYVLLGKTEFEKFIKEYYDKYRFSLVTSVEFKKFLSEKIGEQKTRELMP